MRVHCVRTFHYVRAPTRPTAERPANRGPPVINRTRHTYNIRRAEGPRTQERPLPPQVRPSFDRQPNDNDNNNNNEPSGIVRAPMDLSIVVRRGRRVRATETVLKTYSFPHSRGRPTGGFSANKDARVTRRGIPMRWKNRRKKTCV